jgi:hypothetical protein
VLGFQEIQIDVAFEISSIAMHVSVIPGSHIANGGPIAPYLDIHKTVSISLTKLDIDKHSIQS